MKYLISVFCIYFLIILPAAAAPPYTSKISARKHNVGSFYTNRFESRSFPSELRHGSNLSGTYTNPYSNNTLYRPLHELYPFTYSLSSSNIYDRSSLSNSYPLLYRTFDRFNQTPVSNDDQITPSSLTNQRKTGTIPSPASTHHPNEINKLYQLSKTYLSALPSHVLVHTPHALRWQTLEQKNSILLSSNEFFAVRGEQENSYHIYKMSGDRYNPFGDYTLPLFLETVSSGKRETAQILEKLTNRYKSMSKEDREKLEQDAAGLLINAQQLAQGVPLR